MAHYVICSYCNKTFDRDKEPFVQDRNNLFRYRHKACEEKRRTNLTEKERDYEDLEDCIKAIFGKDYVNRKIINQIKTYRETMGYSYSGMRKSLEYWFIEKKNPIDKANHGIGIIPYIYEEVEEYYRKLFEAQRANSFQTIEQYNPQEAKEIIIKSPQPIRRIPKLFNLEEDIFNE